MAGPLMTRATRSPVSGAQLVFVLAGIFLVTAVVPPFGAWRLNVQRVHQTQERANRAAAAASRDHLAVMAQSVEVACGPGRLPKAAGASGQEAWVDHAVIAPAVFGAGMPTDAWGQCFLMNLGEGRRGGGVWILSAGPNGRVDTPFGATALGGDDIGAIVR